MAIERLGALWDVPWDPYAEDDVIEVSVYQVGDAVVLSNNFCTAVVDCDLCMVKHIF